MKPRLCRQPVIEWLILLTLLCLAAAAAAAESNRFARIDLDEDGTPRALQIAVTRYASPDDNYTVDLIGAVHIGDAAYYADLNERFRGYDALLYELVTPEAGVVPTPGAERTGFVSTAQLGLTSLLGLSYQLDEIDYRQKNFIHADLTAPEFSESMAAADESLYIYLWRLYVASIREYARNPLGLDSWLSISNSLSSSKGNTIKTMLAYEMANFDQRGEVFDGLAESAIIAARNQRAVAVLNDTLDAGAKNIGIFYGVGHMPDFDRRLVEELGYAHAETEWIDAWLLIDDPEAGN